MTAHSPPAKRRRVRLSLLLFLLGMSAWGLARWQRAAFPVTLVMDGQSHTLFTHAADPPTMLRTLGYHLRPEDRLEAPTWGPGARVILHRARPIQVLADGHSRTIWTRAHTAGEALADAHIALAPGDRISLADGMIPIEVVVVEGEAVRVRVLSGGTVTSHKGLNLPGKGDALPSLTGKDREDLRFGLRKGVDWVALSFVRSPRDIEPVRRVMEEEGIRVPVLAKIEKRQALERIDAIVDAFDGIMVARGDLGVEIPIEDVPGAQKDLIRRAVRRAKPVITATQMLLSMVRSPRPTRAETTDVANAILDGTDAVMLSEETAMGEYPVETVATMARIAERAQDMAAPLPDRYEDLDVGGVPGAIARATWRLAKAVGARAIVTPTKSGSTARLVAATRPDVPILALSSEPGVVAALCLTWGVVSRPLTPAASTEALFEACRHEARSLGLARAGERIVVTAGLPLETPGTTNLVKVVET